MQRDWKDIESKGQNAAEVRGTIRQPLEHDTLLQRVSRVMHMMFDDYPEALADTLHDLTEQLRQYILSVKREARKVEEEFKEYRLSHSDHAEEDFRNLQAENARLEAEVQRLLKTSKVLLEGTNQRDAEIDRLRATIVELQDRLDGAKTQG